MFDQIAVTMAAMVATAKSDSTSEPAALSMTKPMTAAETIAVVAMGTAAIDSETAADIAAISIGSGGGHSKSCDSKSGDCIKNGSGSGTSSNGSKI